MVLTSDSSIRETGFRMKTNYYLVGAVAFSSKFTRDSSTEWDGACKGRSF